MDDQIRISHPTSIDARAMRRIAADSGVLSVNSTYFYALMSRHFNSTCLVARNNDKICGYVIGYRPPDRQDTVFVWQVGVAVDLQGKGLGKKLLTNLVRKTRVLFLEATIAPENKASVSLFRSVARFFETGDDFSEDPYFDTNDLGPEEEAEHLMRIGPFDHKQEKPEPSSV